MLVRMIWLRARQASHACIVWQCNLLLPALTSLWCDGFSADRHFAVANRQYGVSTTGALALVRFRLPDGWGAYESAYIRSSILARDWRCGIFRLSWLLRVRNESLQVSFDAVQDAFRILHHICTESRQPVDAKDTLLVTQFVRDGSSSAEEEYKLCRACERLNGRGPRNSFML